MRPPSSQEAANKRKKCRTGCSTCKKRKIKCDETRPACNQCLSKRLVCPGFAQRLKWSSKYEKLHQDSKLQERPSEPRKDEESLRQETNAIELPIQQISTICNGVSASNSKITWSPDYRRLHASSSPLIQDSIDLGDINHDTLSQQQESPQLDLKETELQKNSESGLNTRAITTKNVRDSYHVILNQPILFMDYFSQKLCKALSIYDSDLNPFRANTLTRVKDSLLYSSLSRYLTVAYLLGGNPSGSGNLILREAQSEILHRLEREISSAYLERQNKQVGVLLAIIMYGLTTSWDGSNDSGLLHYNAAVDIFNEIPHLQANLRSFFSETLIYWWMGLCFVTSTTHELLKPPPMLAAVDSRKNEKRTPHPLTGVAPYAHLLLGRVGALAYTQRIGSYQHSFTTMENMMREFKTFEQAQILEEEILSLGRSSIHDICATGDPDTSVQDLINVGEAYRLSALLLIYRVFPDLLTTRLGKGSYSEQNSSTESWMVSLAVHILEVLELNPTISGTKSVEQLILVIVAGELKTSQKRIVDNELNAPKESCTTASPLFAWSDSSPRYETPSTPLNSLTPQTSDLTTTVSESESSQTHSIASENDGGVDEVVNVEGQILSVQQARETLLRRLAAIRSILPYKSLEYVEQLIKDSWRRSDLNLGTFWMDIMIEKDWRFLMV